MSQETCLERAHSLSAHASILLAPGQVTAQTLSLALKAYSDAADLFEQASNEADDISAKRTLQLLTNQHRKLAKDLERKLDRGEGSSRAAQVETLVRGTVRRSQTTPVPPRDGPSMGLGAIGREVWPPPGIATRVSPARGLPPFAMRPTTSTIESNPIDQLSPLHSSSSSSGTETGTGGSYYNFGAIPDTLDPFSRFWGKLDNMLDDISNPVAFATASMGTPANAIAAEGEGDREKRERRRTSERKKDKERQRAESPGSFYLVNKHALPRESTGSSRTTSPTEKTPEELLLENENLRISLDAIASHAQKVDDENKRLKAESEERNKMMKSAILEVKREAVKVKQGQDLMRSQLLGSIPSPNPRRLEASRALPAQGDLVNHQKKRIESLEEELRLLKIENEKNKDAAARYKERIDKIKANAKVKKEAKMRGEDSSRA